MGVEMKSGDRHPIGVMPEWLALEERAQALNEAIARFLAAGETPMPEWGEELARISRRLLQIRKERYGTP